MGEAIEERFVTALLSDDPDDLSDEALAALLNFAKRVVRFWYDRRVINETDLDEVAHDAVAAAWRARHTFQGRAAFTTWLSRIALRTAYKQGYKRGGKFPSVSLETGDDMRHYRI